MLQRRYVVGMVVLIIVTACCLTVSSFGSIVLPVSSSQGRYPPGHHLQGTVRFTAEDLQNSTRFQQEVSEHLNRLGMTPKSIHDGFVTTFATAGYTELLRSFVQLAQANHVPIYIFAVDAAAADELKLLGLSSFYTFAPTNNFEVSDRYDSIAFRKIARLRFLVLAALAQRYSFFSSDVDVAWLRSPFPFESVSDLSFSQDNPSPNRKLVTPYGVYQRYYCAGLFHVRSGLPSVGFLRLVFRTTGLVGRNDQHIVNDLVKAHTTADAAVSLLDDDTFCNGHVYFDQHRPQLRGFIPIAVHANWASGASVKRLRLIEAGFAEPSLPVDWSTRKWLMYSFSPDECGGALLQRLMLGLALLISVRCNRTLILPNVYRWKRFDIVDNIDALVRYEFLATHFPQHAPRRVGTILQERYNLKPKFICLVGNTNQGCPGGYKSVLLPGPPEKVQEELDVGQFIHVKFDATSIRYGMGHLANFQSWNVDEGALTHTIWSVDAVTSAFAGKALRSHAASPLMCYHVTTPREVTQALRTAPGFPAGFRSLLIVDDSPKQPLLHALRKVSNKGHFVFTPFDNMPATDLQLSLNLTMGTSDSKRHVAAAEMCASANRFIGSAASPWSALTCAIRKHVHHMAPCLHRNDWLGRPFPPCVH